MATKNKEEKGYPDHDTRMIHFVNTECKLEIVPVEEIRAIAQMYDAGKQPSPNIVWHWPFHIRMKDGRILLAYDCYVAQARDEFYIDAKVITEKSVDIFTDYRPNN